MLVFTLTSFALILAFMAFVTFEEPEQDCSYILHTNQQFILELQYKTARGCRYHIYYNDGNKVTRVGYVQHDCFTNTDNRILIFQ